MKLVTAEFPTLSFDTHVTLVHEGDCFLFTFNCTCQLKTEMSKLA